MADQQPIVKIDIKGLANLQLTLDKMQEDMAAKNIVASAYSANKLMEEAIKANISSDGLIDTGLLQKSIARKKVIYAQDATVVIITGINKNVRGVDSKGNARVPWRYANVLEPKYGFVKDAFDTVKQEVVDRFVKSLKAKVKKFEKNSSNPPSV
jgi:hypothetical protein